MSGSGRPSAARNGEATDVGSCEDGPRRHPPSKAPGTSLAVLRQKTEDPERDTRQQ